MANPCFPSNSNKSWIPRAVPVSVKQMWFTWYTCANDLGGQRSNLEPSNPRSHTIFIEDAMRRVTAAPLFWGSAMCGLSWKKSSRRFMLGVLLMGSCSFSAGLCRFLFGLRSPWEAQRATVSKSIGICSFCVTFFCVLFWCNTFCYLLHFLLNLQINCPLWHLSLWHEAWGRLRLLKHLFTSQLFQILLRTSCSQDLW